MKKLELNHIAPYLPYDLQFKDHETVAPGVMVAIVAGMPGLLFYEDKDEIEYFDLYAVKPLLIPLTQIGQANWFAILMQGLHQTVPPIVNMMPTMVPVIELHDDIGVELCYPGTHYSFSYDFKNKQFEGRGIRFNQLAVIEELYKHHADIHGLIDAGLGLNKLDYQNK